MAGNGTEKLAEKGGYCRELGGQNRPDAIVMLST